MKNSKKTYATPVLQSWGTVRNLTGGSSGSFGDGGGGSKRLNNGSGG